MADIVNLRQARKRKARAAAEAQAADNRALFGRSRQERDAQTAARRTAEKLLDGHRRDTGGDVDS